MMPGGLSLGHDCLGYVPDPEPFPVQFLDALVEDGQYLIEVSAYKGGQARAGGLATLAEIPLADIPKSATGTTVGQVTQRWADRHWVGSPIDDVMPNVFYEGRVVAPLSMTRGMPILPEEERRTFRQFGAVEIANGDGGLDAFLRNYAVDGRRVRILFGPYMGEYADFRVIADTLATGWEGDDILVRIALRDQGYSLDLPLQEDLYLGTGGAEGTAEIQGKPKPLLFGRCRNVTAILIDPTNLIYQVHDGAIFAVDAVYDRGANLTASGVDVASYAALVAQSVTAGQFATALSVGLFKLGALPAGLVTADVRGDATTGVANSGYINTFDTIALRILRDRHGLDATLVDGASFAGAGAIGGEMGIYLGVEPVTTAQVMTTLLQSVAGWWGAGRDGRIKAGRLNAPEDRSPNLYLDEFDILDLSPEQTPVPRWRQRVGFLPNWTVQRGEDLAASVTAARRQFLAFVFSVVSSADAVTRVRHLQALDPDPLPSLYENETDAQALSDYLLALHSPDRRIFTVTVKRIGFRLDIGKVVRITWPRYGLSSGQNFTVVGIAETADASGDRVVLRIWG